MSLTTRTDITSVKLYKSFILAGVGSWLNVFEKTSTNFLQRIRAFVGQKIHGIVPSKCEKLLVFGGKKFTIFDIISIEKHIELKVTTKESTCDDWLLSGIWTDEEKIALLTAHNVVQIWDTSNRKLLIQHKSMDNCILYSGLLFQIEDDILVFAGTVCSEVIVHRCGRREPIQRLNNHTGAIFSISFKPENKIIVTTSDDRSMCIWSVSSDLEEDINTKDYWDDAHIVCEDSVYGHKSRVMRSCITDDMIITAGEDARICFWNYEGDMLRRKMAHQSASVWSIDADDVHLLSGGGDSGLVLHPLTYALEYGELDIIYVDRDPKEIRFTARNNIVILREKDLIYYNTTTRVTQNICEFDSESNYLELSISSCKQLIAVVDMQGNLDIFVESCKKDATLSKILNKKLDFGEIYSMHWAGNRHLVFCSKIGVINVLVSNGSDIESYGKFIMPQTKNRFLTAVAMDSSNRLLAVGDRRGHVYVFVKDKTKPIETFRNVHGRYGPTSITINNKEIITTGRDGTVRSFLITHNEKVRFMNGKKFEFQWIGKFADKCDNIIFGFQERNFIVFDTDSNMNWLEVDCGGGHRSWDAIRHIDKVDNGWEEFITYIFIKNSDICQHKFQLSKIISKTLIKGSHSKEINCLKAYRAALDDSKMYYISGGEDTTLRISSVDSKYEFKDEVVFKNLSSIRTLKTYPVSKNRVLIVAGGGRAQITFNFLDFQKYNGKVNLYTQEMANHTIPRNDEDTKFVKPWLGHTVNKNPEIRVMDLDAMRVEIGFMIFVACSDGCVRVFQFGFTVYDHALIHVAEMNYHKTCILKAHCTKVLNRNILVTCTTRGMMAFWDIHDKSHEDYKYLQPFMAMQCNQSGINGLTSKILSDTRIVIALGCDDNSVSLILLECSDSSDVKSLKRKFSRTSEKCHSSQVTGVLLFENYLLSTSVDQRITLFEWNIVDDEVVCKFISQGFSDVADIHGMDLLPNGDHLDVCVYGKGMEVIRIEKKSDSNTKSSGSVSSSSQP